jgi:hypothetical protein
MCGMGERSRWALSLATVPLWPIVWLLMFASAARVKLGYWPSYDQPDPSTLHWFPADLAVLPLLLLAPIAAFTSVIVALFRWTAGRPAWSVCLMTLASFGVLLLWLAFDPGGFFNWWAD